MEIVPCLEVLDTDSPPERFETGLALKHYLQQYPNPSVCHASPTNPANLHYSYNKYTPNDVLLTLSHKFNFDSFGTFLRGFPWENSNPPAANAAVLSCQYNDGTGISSREISSCTNYPYLLTFLRKLFVPM